MPTLPKSTGTTSARILRALTKPYESFALAFKTGDAQLFRQEIGLTSEVFRIDGNAGLAAQCMEAFRRTQIIALRDTYVTLGVHEIAQKKFDVTGRGGDVGGEEETERVILGMVGWPQPDSSLIQANPSFRSSVVRLVRRSRSPARPQGPRTLPFTSIPLQSKKPKTFGRWRSRFRE